MKRKMDFNQEEDDFNRSLSTALNYIEKRNKEDHVVLVDGGEKLAEKVEPGYLVKLAEEIEKANDFVFHNACGKLKVIEEQMNFLKRQACKVLAETKINAKLHSLPCNFSKKTGQIYTVYEKPSGECYLSMLSPREWGANCPHNFIGSYKLNAGMSWNPVDEYSANGALQKWISPDESNAMMIE
ncbi:uncharacterized protein C1orf50 homolog [Planococcus citri]|uniref:uncharacterized protein C1orf50 homolog n=1 Tax=Planococcus citri TaxID=170843 RepID=UPI0031F9110B